MNKISDDFNNYIDSITIAQRDIDDIVAKHNSFREMIQKNPPEGYSIERIRLSGSYAKGLVVKDEDKKSKPDVDMIIIFKNMNYNISKIATDIEKYLNEKKGNISKNIRKQSNSFRVEYENIDLDIVIAREINGKLEIASFKNNTWQESNCLKQVDYYKNINDNYKYDYKGLMKIFKYMNKNILKYSIKSYTMEMFVNQCVPKSSIMSIQEAVLETLIEMNRITNIAEIKDCVDKNKSGYDIKDFFHFSSFKAEISLICGTMEMALNGNRKLLEEIFGEKFPKQNDVIVKDRSTHEKKHTPYCN